MKERQTNINMVINDLCRYLYEQSGMVLDDSKRDSVYNRLNKRWLSLDITSSGEYVTYYWDNRDRECNELFSVLLNHHTFFFREFIQYERLRDDYLSDLIRRARARSDKTIRIWSAACSKGDEAYSLAMFFSYHLKQVAPDIKYKIVASDVDARSVSTARNGVYEHESLKKVPVNYIDNHWARGRGDIANYVKAKASLCANIEFRVLNLKDFQKNLTTERFDVVFCRNVFIYFERELITAICKQIARFLHPSGLFFIGVSETLMDDTINLDNLRQSIYISKTKDAETIKAVSIEAKKAVMPTPQSAALSDRPQVVAAVKPEAKKIFRILTVDDSSSIQLLLGKIFNDDPGYEVVATAVNGIEAWKAIQTHEIDAMTLDIHMPEMDGIGYLKKRMFDGHPPVIMVTSVTRSDQDLAQKALDLGAVDYVEKPTLANIANLGGELKSKVSSAISLWRSGAKNVVASLDREFSQQMTIENVGQKIRIIVCDSIRDPAIIKLLKEFNGTQPPHAILQRSGNSSEGVDTISSATSMRIITRDVVTYRLQPGEIIVGDFFTTFPQLFLFHQTDRCSMLVFDSDDATVMQYLSAWKNGRIIVEDGKSSCYASSTTIDSVPRTSFAHISTQFLASESEENHEYRAVI